MTELSPLQLSLAGAAVGALAWLFWPKKAEAKRPLSSVALVGDSLGVGLGPPLAEALKPAKLVTQAHVSATARDWATGKYASELDAVLAKKPELVLVSLGTNDTVPPGKELSLELPENFKTITDKVRKSGAKPVFVIVNQSWSLQRVEEAAALAGARLIQTEGLSRNPGDPVHLTGNGYKAWAKIIASDLQGSSTVGHPVECFLP